MRPQDRCRPGDARAANPPDDLAKFLFLTQLGDMSDNAAVCPSFAWKPIPAPFLQSLQVADSRFVRADECVKVMDVRIGSYHRPWGRHSRVESVTTPPHSRRGERSGWSTFDLGIGARRETLGDVIIAVAMEYGTHANMPTLIRKPVIRDRSLSGSRSATERGCGSRISDQITSSRLFARPQKLSC